MSPTDNGEASAYSAGAGGKFRRKPLRKSQPTPYDRPPLAAAVRNSSGANGWLSKIVDPASKIITASANRLFSKMFRKQLLPPPAPEPEVGRTTNEMAMQRSENQVKLGDQSGTDRHGKEHVVLDMDNSDVNKGISELEKILAQKTFTESEISRLTALLNSRTIEVTEEKTFEARAQKTTEDVNLSVFQPSPVPDSGINSTQHRGEASSQISKAKVFEEDIATPAELAKAYMGSRPSKVSPSVIGSWSRTIKNDLPLTNSVLFPSQSPSKSTAIRSLSRVDTPGNGYMTPRLRGRSAIYSMARTPYSRENKSSQLELEANMLLSSRNTALKRRSNILEDDVGSAGPVRKIRQRPGLNSSQRSNEPEEGSSHVNRPGVLSAYSSKNGGSRPPGGNIMPVPSQSSIVAQKILQQLDKLSPSSKEKSSERKPVQLPKSSFTAVANMPSEQPLKSSEKDYSNSDKCCSNGSSFVVAKDKVGIPGSSSENNTQTKSDKNGTVSNRPNKFEKEGVFSYLSGSPTMTIQPTETNKKTTVTPLFGIGAKEANNFSLSTFTPSSPIANGSQALQNLTLPESKIASLSGLFDTPKLKLDDTECTQRAAATDAKPSTTSSGVSPTPALFSSGLLTSNGFTNRSSPVQPSSSSSQFYGVNPASASNVPNAATGLTSSNVSQFFTPVAPLSLSPVFRNSSSGKDPQVSLNANVQLSSVAETGKPITDVKKITGNPFGVSFATANGTNIFSGFDSSKSSLRVENQGIGSDSNDVSASSHVKIATTGSESTPQDTMFQFGSSGFSAAPTSGSSGMAGITSVSTVSSLPGPIFGQNISASAYEAVSVGSTGGSTNSLFGSNWQPNSSPLFGSTTTSSMVPSSVFQFGPSATVSAFVPSCSSPSSFFGSSSASTVSSFSFTSAATGNSQSPFAASKPVFGSSSPAIDFGSSPSPPKIIMEDSMAEDAVPASLPSTSVFGQSQPVANSGFLFGSPSPVTPPGTGIFQFGGQPSAAAAALNQTPFQAPGSFNAGGGFSIGADDKSTRRIVKVKRAPKRR